MTDSKGLVSAEEIEAAIAVVDARIAALEAEVVAKEKALKRAEGTLRWKARGELGQVHPEMAAAADECRAALSKSREGK